jgi:hypothetical protein
MLMVQALLVNRLKCVQVEPAAEDGDQSDYASS